MLKTILNLFSKFSLLKTIYLNFHCLPFKQAIRIPILVTSTVKFENLKGKITLNSSVIKFGSIKIGLKSYGFQSKYDKTILDISGELILNKDIYIGRGTYIEIGKLGKILLGENTFIGGSMKFISHEEIKIGKNARIAWEVTIIDTDFHEYVNIHTQERSLVKKPISIGDDNWIGFGTTILKGTITQNFCIVGARSLLIKEYLVGEYCILAGQPAKKVKEGVYRDLNSFIER